MVHRGVLVEANVDGRRNIKIDDEIVMANFFALYEIDGKIAKHCLQLELYGGEDIGCWVLLDAVDTAAAAPSAATPSAAAPSASAPSASAAAPSSVNQAV